MALRVRFQHTTSQTLKYSVERLTDGYLLDHADNTFKTTPGTLTASLTEDTAAGRYGLYKATITGTPTGQYTNGNYAICVHDDNLTNDPVIGVISAQIIGGDDNYVPATGISSGGGGSGVVDNAAIATAVWEFLTTSTSATGTFGSLLKTNLDTTVSSRSTYSGGAVASVTAPVNVAATGLDAVIVETGVNLRQANSLMVAALAGEIISVTGTYTIKSPVTEVTRIQATADASGNRNGITVTLPT